MPPGVRLFTKEGQAMQVPNKMVEVSDPTYFSSHIDVIGQEVVGHIWSGQEEGGILPVGLERVVQPSQWEVMFGNLDGIGVEGKDFELTS